MLDRRREPLAAKLNRGNFLLVYAGVAPPAWRERMNEVGVTATDAHRLWTKELAPLFLGTVMRLQDHREAFEHDWLQARAASRCIIDARVYSKRMWDPPPAGYAKARRMIAADPAATTFVAEWWQLQDRRGVAGPIEVNDIDAGEWGATMTEALTVVLVRGWRQNA